MLKMARIRDICSGDCAVAHRDCLDKMLEITTYREDFLLKLTSLPTSQIEMAESIEQMRILEIGFNLSYVEIAPALPSINEPGELLEVLDLLSADSEQQHLLKATTNS
jgi:CMP-2-keto-3-deoxyoctulosonic acid synthetase